MFLGVTVVELQDFLPLPWLPRTYHAVVVVHVLDSSEVQESVVLKESNHCRVEVVNELKELERQLVGQDLVLVLHQGVVLLECMDTEE